MLERWASFQGGQGQNQAPEMQVDEEMLSHTSEGLWQ